jgi:hypothetical protein
VACLLSHWAFVFSVLPMSSSLPMQIISMFVVMVFTFCCKNDWLGSLYCLLINRVKGEVVRLFFLA